MKIDTKRLRLVLVPALFILGYATTVAAADPCKASTKESWADRVDLNDLIPYTYPTAAWSDRHSDIAITWSKPESPGIQRLDSVVGWGGTQITESLLSWNLSEDGRSLPLRLKHRNFRPDKVVESDEVGDFTVTATAAFPAYNAIAVRFSISNPSERIRNLTVDFEYPGKGVAPDWKGPFQAGSIVSTEYGPQGSWSTLYKHHEHGRNVAWVRDFVAGMTEGTTLEMVCLSDLSSRQIHLSPRGESNFTVVMAMGRNRGRAHQSYQEAKRKVAQGWIPDIETARIRGLLRKAPLMAPKYRGNPKYERLYAHAITGLNSLYIRGEGGYTGETRVPYTTKHLLAIAFFWDTSFSSVGAREFDPLLGQEAIENFVNNATPRGSLPGTLSDTHRAGEGQAPIMCWSAWHIYQSGHDKAWLARVYPGLSGYVKFWLKYHSSSRGLAQFFNAGQIGDNDARFDRVYNRDNGGVHGNEAVSGFESPDLNAFLVVEMRSLELMASELKLAEEAIQWENKANKLAKLIVDCCYFPDEAMFYDVVEGTHEKFTGVKNPNMFLPLWAGVPLPEAEIHRIVEKHMLNPNEFFRTLPFPSLSYDNPKYESGDYWRGRIWPHFVYWMAQTLWQAGYHKEAELTADRLLDMMQIQPWLMENFNSDPQKIGRDGYDLSQPEYNWTESSAIELLLERYKEDVSPRLLASPRAR
ncbi:MAG TPA: trehalase family glycosidase [Terriglobales bacterium]|nr:trehalase family glycosidase [Terriglobales bacterium]